jgi:DNA repair protein RecO (recombination protein O)
MLRELGLMPALEACVHCGKLVEPGAENVAFGMATGGVLCQGCRAGQPHVTLLSRATLDALRTLAAPGSDWRSLALADAAMAPVRSTLGGVFSHLLGRPPKLLPFLGGRL